MVERILGEVGRHAGQWFFTVWVSFRGEKQQYGPFGPWTSKAIAQKEMKKCSQLFSNELDKVPTRIPVPSIFPEKNSVPIFTSKGKKQLKKKKPLSKNGRVKKSKRGPVDDRRKPILDACDLQEP
jgi:hypothetical protein